MGQEAHVEEITSPLTVQTNNGSNASIRVFRLSLKHNGLTVELCSVGASITKILWPKSNGSGTDDIVLGYKSPLEMFSSGNPPFLGVIVGRVANRIAKGQFQLDNNEDYKLELNNGPNHLHGGHEGFSRRLWDMEIVDVPGSTTATSRKGVRCTLESPDGDQGYPGTVLVSATYSLQPNESGKGATLRLDMKAQRKGGSKPSPINLAQHTYFNLAGHQDPRGILDHKVKLACEAYTPNDATSIPTRQVVAVKDDPAMDLTEGNLMKDSLKRYAMTKAGLTEEEASQHLMATARCGPTVAKSGTDCLTPGEPYGFDHNYVVPRGTSNGSLNLVGTVEHEPSKRRMTVASSAPGVQVYTGNYLDGVHPGPQICKDGATYGQWQGMCLETQHYPDSILSGDEEAQFPDFAKGKCPILRPRGADYEHTVEYRFEDMD